MDTHITKTTKKPISKRKSMSSTRIKKQTFTVLKRERNLTGKFSKEKRKALFKFNFDSRQANR